MSGGTSMGFIKTKIKSFFAYKSDREVQNKELLDFAIGVGRCRAKSSI